MSGGHFGHNWKTFRTSRRDFPKLSTVQGGKFVSSLQRVGPFAETSTTSSNPLLISKSLQEEGIPKETKRNIQALQLQVGGGQKVIDEDSDSSEDQELKLDHEEELKIQEKIDEALRKPIRVKSIDLSKRKQSSQESTDQAPPKKLKTYKFNVV